MSRKRDLKALEQRRLRAAQLLRQGLSEAAVARELGVSRNAVNVWAGVLAQRGRSGLRAKPVGRPGALTAAQKRQLVNALKRGALAAGYATELWTLPRVAKLIEQRCKIQYSTVHVWRLLRALGFSPQRPAKRALERDEAAIRRWKQQRWPQVKKTAKSRAG